ncbi:MAG: hypothetical protein AABY11_02405 [archaeon]
MLPIKQMGMIPFVVATVLVVVLLYFFMQLPSAGIGDASQYVCSAQNISQNGFFPGNWYASGLGYPLMIILTHFLGFDWEWGARMLSLLAALALLWLIGDTLSRFFNDSKAFLYILPFFFTYDFLTHAVLGYVGTIFTFFIFLSLNLWLRAHEKKSTSHSANSHPILPSALAFGIAIWTRTASLFFIPFFIREAFRFHRTKNNFLAYGVVILFIFAAAFLASFNTRDDTSLSYLPLTAFADAVFPNVIYYFLLFVQQFPVILPFLVFVPISLSALSRSRFYFWVIPSILGVLFFPLGVNLYYLFPVIPFLLYAGFKGMDTLFHRFFSVRVKEYVVGGGVLLSILILLPGIGLLPHTVERYQEIDAGFSFLDHEYRAGKSFLLITGREGELFATRWGNAQSCNFNRGPEMIIHPYTVTHLYNQSDNSIHREAAQEKIDAARKKGIPIYVTSSAYVFAHEGWCPALGCISLPTPQPIPVFQKGVFILYAAQVSDKS